MKEESINHNKLPALAVIITAMFLSSNEFCLLQRQHLAMQKPLVGIFCLLG